MLEQMGKAVDPRRLVARAGIGIKADGDGFEAGHRPAGDLEAAGESGELHHEAADLGAQGSGGNVPRFRRRNASTKMTTAAAAKKNHWKA